jgi:hypothetical protein
MRTSIYADDAVIFMAPIKEDIEVLSWILQGFREVAGLVTNVNNSLVAPIRSSKINVQAVLHGFPAPRANFPIRYLGFLYQFTVFVLVIFNTLWTRWHPSSPLVKKNMLPPSKGSP